MIIKEGRLNLCTLAIDQLNVEEGALAAVVFPGLLVMLFGDSRFNLPVKKERVEAFDGCVALTALGKQGSSFLSR